MTEMSLSPAILSVLSERERQIDDKGYSAEHDDQYTLPDLAYAGMCYARHYAQSAWKCEPFANRQGEYVDRTMPSQWPWAAADWNPKTPREDLVRATALLLAEIERIDRRVEGRE